MINTYYQVANKLQRTDYQVLRGDQQANHGNAKRYHDRHHRRLDHDVVGYDEGPYARRLEGVVETRGGVGVDLVHHV